MILIIASLQNHLIETASHQTGSMIIWDTGEYEILPYQMDPSGPETDDSRSEVSEDGHVSPEPISDSAKLREAFQNVGIPLYNAGTRGFSNARTLSAKSDSDCMEPVYRKTTL